MQYALPQFTDVEDKLIGPLTLKQFLSLLATGGLVLFFWSIFGLNIFFFIFALPIALLGIFVTFGRFNGRGLFSYVFPFLYFLARPRARVFLRETPTVTLKKTDNRKLASVGAAAGKQEAEEPTENRLKTTT